MTGHIRRRGERSWELKFDLGRDPSTGKRQSRYRSFKGTKREAHAELTRLTAEALRGTYIDATSETVGRNSSSAGIAIGRPSKSRRRR